ncbi:MAG: hypothetical protein UR92_C0003G0019 [Candidatus Nomurabacteria bacterium GW2011_GWA2_35_80]|uniref:MSP domain-containing protein n=1 Tax=Candidatus Nomurabacteria bacterium GW2011_GWA2_35_80 TaxID=1618733 RepID=A0A0G0G9W5_9BACT|nr:MAG: hypothetical protein UR92_C0003G0019 [Candidatus Nomurabacteria bacterium GW2011_GWA2_35_80]
MKRKKPTTRVIAFAIHTSFDVRPATVAPNDGFFAPLQALQPYLKYF